MFALVDCNNFYVSCERVFNPALCNRPVVVLSNNDGCIISRSQEAKALGIPMASAVFKHKDLLEQHDVVLFSPNFALYGDMSSRVMNTLGGMLPDIEIYSIDEAFADLQGFRRYDPGELAESVRDTIKRNTGIPVSVGVGPTKTLAKIANHLAKKNCRYHGVCVLEHEDAIRSALGDVHVGDVWGIGRGYSRLLRSHAIETALDLADVSPEWVKRHMHINGSRVQQELNGVSCLFLEHVRSPRKSICTSRSFGKKVTKLEELENAVGSFASRCAARLREERLLAGFVTVFVYTGSFDNPRYRYRGGRTVAMPVETQNTLEIVQYALDVLKEVYRKGSAYKKAGVVLSGLFPASVSCVTPSLFDENGKFGRDSQALMQAIDMVNSRYGSGTLRLAVAGSSGWKQRMERLSPRYTTCWEDIIDVKT